MGEFADYVVDEMYEEEFQRDQFANSRMSNEEAFERGYLDPAGGLTDFADMTSDRISIDTYENVLDELDGLETELEGLCSRSHTSVSVIQGNYPELNTKALINLFKETPTCNSCETSMKQRTGKFGDFYYCPNKCSDQKTVSKAYWDKVRQPP